MPHSPCSRLFALLLAGLIALQAAPALADPASERAKHHNELAKKLFNLGLFREAAEEYRKAYEAKPAPAFLFNLAQCHKRMTTAENLERAIFYYRSYLNNVPDSPVRADVEAEIEKLERELKVIRRPPPFYKRWWFWTVIGVAVTSATVATVIALQPEDQRPVEGTGGNFEISP